MSAHHPHVLPTPDGYKAVCTCTYRVVEVPNILTAFQWALAHRKFEAAVEKTITEMDRKGFLISLEEL